MTTNDLRKRLLAMGIGTALALAPASMMLGCEGESAPDSAEDVGEEIDEGIEEAGDAIEEAADDLED